MKKVRLNTGEYLKDINAQVLGIIECRLKSICMHEYIAHKKKYGDKKKPITYSQEANDLLDFQKEILNNCNSSRAEEIAYICTHYNYQHRFLE